MNIYIYIYIYIYREREREREGERERNHAVKPGMWDLSSPTRNWT